MDLKTNLIMNRQRWFSAITFLLVISVVLAACMVQPAAKAMENPALAKLAPVKLGTVALADSPDYFDDYQHLHLSRDDNGVLLVEMHTDGGPIIFDAQDHTEFTEAFYRIGRDLDNKIVILTGNTDYMAQIDAASFLENPDPYAGLRVQDEGVQILENLLNIHVPVIAAVEGKAHIHSEYALTANIIIAGKSASFTDLPHFNFGVVPGDGIFTAWSYRAGPGRAESFLLNPQPISAQVAQEWGVVAEVVKDGTTVERARELADLFLAKPELVRRNTRIHFAQPLKEKIVAEVGFGLTLEVQAFGAP